MYGNFHDDVESEQLLEPISGFPAGPILSLEEACQSLHNCVEHLASAIQFSMKHAEKHTGGLLDDESASIYLFTLKWPRSSSSFSTILSRTLRNSDRRLLKPWIPYLKLFLTALFKLPDFNGTVWCCVKQNLSRYYKDGEKCVWWTATLCTSSLTTLDLESDDPCTVFSIETTQGKYVANYSYFKTSEDVLLLPGTYFRVVGQLMYKNGLCTIHLKEQQPPYPLLEIPFQMTEQTQLNESTSSIDQTDKLCRPKTAGSFGPQICSVCLQCHSSKLAYRIEAPKDTCTHEGRVRCVCDYCLYQHVTNLLHPSISNPVTCPEVGCSRRSYLSDEHVRRILLHGGGKTLWNSRQSVKSRSHSSERWIQHNALPCPKCQAPIMKSGGCDRMKCARCSHHFYWSEAAINGWQKRFALSRPSTAKTDGT